MVRKRFLVDFLANKADDLQEKYAVTINEVVLDTLQVSSANNAPHTNVHLFKQNSNRLAMPLVDPSWY